METFNVVISYNKNEFFLRTVSAYTYLGALNQVETTGISLDDPLIKEIIIKKADILKPTKLEYFKTFKD